MSLKSFQPGRRRWLRLGSLAAIAVAEPAAFAQAPKPGAQPKRVDENEQQALALGYKHDAAKVDKAKFKNFQAGQLCSNCNLFKGKADDAWGPCDIFGGREVNANGWCAAWVKKPT
jgi:High potential iron-sulfur protein